MEDIFPTDLIHRGAYTPNAPWMGTPLISFINLCIFVLCEFPFKDFSKTRTKVLQKNVSQGYHKIKRLFGSNANENFFLKKRNLLTKFK